jgi:flagellar protein FliO/FliZ
MEVLARQPLTRAASLAVVRVGDRHLVVGVTEQSVTLIDEADGALFAPAAALVAPEQAEGHGTALPGSAPAGRSGPAWTALVDALREKTVRRS